MAITTLDGMLAGIQPVRYFSKAATGITRGQSSWGQAGIPGAGSWSGALNGATYSSSGGLVNGQIVHTDPGGGLQSNLARLSFAHLTGSNGAWVMLCDRLWDNGGIDVTITTQQAISTSTWPARDQVGGTTGVGVLVAMEVSATVVGAATPTFTLDYTNSAGNTTRSGSNIAPTVGAPVAGSAWILSLQSGDVGVKSIQHITLSNAWTSGTINLVAFRPLAMISANLSLGTNDCITGGFPRLYDGVVPFWIYQCGSAPSIVHGMYMESQG